MMMYDTTVVIIAAFNEEATVGQVVKRVIDLGFTALVVDDGSRDGTFQVANEAGAHVLRLPINLGVGGALRCGFRWAVGHNFDTVIQCDADGQHPPEEIPGLLTYSIENSLHLAIGTRFKGYSEFQSTAIRRVPMRLMARIASRAAGATLTDTSSGFRVIREPLLSEFARNFPAHYLGDTFDVTVEAGRKGYRIGEKAVKMQARAGGIPSSNALWSTIYLFRSLVVLLLRSQDQFEPYERAIK